MTLAEKLVDAEAAYHRLVTGQAASVLVDQNGERIEYSKTNLADLRAYITALKQQLVGTGMPSGPMRVWL